MLCLRNVNSKGDVKWILTIAKIETINSDGDVNVWVPSSSTIFKVGDTADFVGIGKLLYRTKISHVTSKVRLRENGQPNYVKLQLSGKTGFESYLRTISPNFETEFVEF